MLNVTWSPPNPTGNLPINGYKIIYTDKRTKEKYTRNISNTRSVALEQLNPGTRYSVKIKAINTIGEGDDTKVFASTTGRGLSVHNTDTMAVVECKQLLYRV